MSRGDTSGYVFYKWTCKAWWKHWFLEGIRVSKQVATTQESNKKWSQLVYFHCVCTWQKPQSRLSHGKTGKIKIPNYKVSFRQFIEQVMSTSFWHNRGGDRLDARRGVFGSIQGGVSGGHWHWCLLRETLINLPTWYMVTTT